MKKQKIYILLSLIILVWIVWYILWLPIWGKFDTFKNPNSNIEKPTISNGEIVEFQDIECNLDSECETPAQYMIQSHCPYISKCVESKCAVVCPNPYKWRKIEENVVVDEEIDMTEVIKKDFDYKWILKDVTKWKEVRWINTKSIATWAAMSRFKDDKYELLVTFENLPKPIGTDFYEWWIVKKGLNVDVISTWVLKLVDWKYINEFESTKDLTDHDFYVLTIEPDDGNPAPAEHILEGTMDMVK